MKFKTAYKHLFVLTIVGFFNANLGIVWFYFLICLTGGGSLRGQGQHLIDYTASHSCDSALENAGNQRKDYWISLLLVHLFIISIIFYIFAFTWCFPIHELSSSSNPCSVLVYLLIVTVNKTVD